MLSDENFAVWQEMMGPLRLYAHPDGQKPIPVALPEGRESIDVPCDQEVEPLELVPGIAFYYLGYSRPNGAPAAQVTQPMRLRDGDTFTITARELQEAIQ